MLRGTVFCKNDIPDIMNILLTEDYDENINRTKSKKSDNVMIFTSII